MPLKRAAVQRVPESELFASARFGPSFDLGQVIRILLLAGLLVVGLAFWNLLVDMDAAWAAVTSTLPNILVPGLAPTPVLPVAPSPGPSSEPGSPSPAADATGSPLLSFGQAAAASADTPSPTLGPDSPSAPSDPPAGMSAPSPDASNSPSPSPSASPSPTQEPSPTPPPAPTPTPPPAATPTPASSGRAPYVLLLEPAEGATVAAGPVTVGARASTTSSIRSISVQVDGNAVSVTLQQRSDSIWLGAGTASVSAGHHTVRVLATDSAGRTGSYTWSFTAR